MKLVKRLLPLVALVLCAVVMLTACGGLSFNKKMIEKSYVKDSLTHTKLSSFDGYSIAGGSDEVLIFSKTIGTGVQFRVYNLRTEQEITEATTEYTAEQVTAFVQLATTAPVSVNGRVIEIAKINTVRNEITYNYYTVTGEPISTASDERGVFVNDCLWVNGTVYRFDPVAEEPIITSYERNELAGDIPTADTYNEDYYYDMDGSSLFVYDKEYKLLGSWTAPSYAESLQFHVFADGYAVAQYRVILDENAEKYDLFMNGTKYDFVTVRINPKNCKASNINTDYILGQVYPVEDKDDTANILGNLKNYAVVYEIKDRRVDTTYSMIMDLSSSLSGSRVWYHNGENIEPAYAGNGYIALRGEKTGTVWLFDAKGKEVGEINGAKAFTEKFILGTEAIYDYSLNKLCDIEVAGVDNLVYKSRLGNNLLFQATNGTGTYYLYTGGTTFTFLGDSAALVMDQTEYGVYAEKNATGNYTYYDASRQQLFTSLSVASFTAVTFGEGENMVELIIATATDLAGNTNFYILK